jgi:hypothetical protein
MPSERRFGADGVLFPIEGGGIAKLGRCIGNGVVLTAREYLLIDFKALGRVRHLTDALNACATEAEDAEAMS